MGAVLDASALLALLNEEPGFNEVESVLGRAAVSAVNLSETAGKLVDRGMSSAEVHEVLEGLDLVVHPFDVEAAYAAAELRRIAPANLSLGDRACLALAGDLGCEALTADSSWREVANLETRIRLIR